MNLLPGVFNMLPGSPLDGNRVLHELIWWVTGDPERATTAATAAGQILGGLLAGMGILRVLNGRSDSVLRLPPRVHCVLAERLKGLRAADVMARAPVLG